MYCFDEFESRAGTDSYKWHGVEDGVLPMWVADMDIKAAPEIVAALTERASHPFYGYPYTEDGLKDHIVSHYKRLYGAHIERDWIVLVPSVISGVVNTLKLKGGTFMYSVPMYDHIRTLHKEARLPFIEVPLKKEGTHYSMDISALEAAVTAEVSCLILCSPHNPVGRVFTAEELLALDDFCKRHGLTVISDEIHCELDLESRHIPYFSLSAGAAVNSVTLSSAGKICNIPGLPFGFAIIPDDELRQSFAAGYEGLLPSGNVMTLAAYEKAYDGSLDEWKDALRQYLRENRDIAEARFAAIPGIKAPHNEGTYLLWLDCSGLGVEDPAAFFLEKARVRVSGGDMYGDPTHVRFNYGCTRKQLTEAIDRMERAVAALNRDK